MKNIFTISLCLFSSLIFAQAISLGRYPKTVPVGKKWLLDANQPLLIELDNLSLKSGSLCNARILSEPRILTGIIEGDYGRPNEAYAIIFKGLEKEPYGNGFTYSITPITIVDSKFSLSELQYSQPENVGSKKICFYPGQKVYVGDCMRTLQLLEMNLSAEEILIQKKKEGEQMALALSHQKEQEEKQKQEDEKVKSKISLPDYFFDLEELSNEPKLSIQKPLFDTLFKYQKALNVEGKATTNRRQSHSAFNMFLYFTSIGDIVKIVNDGKDNSSERFTVSEETLKALKPFLRLSSPGLVTLDGKDNPVKCKLSIVYSIRVDTIRGTTVEFSKAKDGRLTIKNNPAFYNQDSDEKTIYSNLILEDNRVKAIEKGKYIVTINHLEIHSSLKVAKTGNNNQRQYFDYEGEKDVIGSIEKQ